MDNTTHGPNAQPSPSTPASQGSGQISTSGQLGQQHMSQPGAGIPPQAPPVPPQNIDPPPAKITLEDLYGPSGFANPQENVPVVPAPSQSFIPTSPTMPPASAQQPVQGGQSQEQMGVSQPGAISASGDSQIPPQGMHVVQNIPSQTPPFSQNPSPIPDLPTFTAPTQQASRERDRISQVVPGAGNVAGAEPSLTDLPMRKPSFQQSLESHDDVPSSPPSGVPREEKKRKISNTFFLLRILFGVVGTVFALVVILFLVTWTSSFFHPVSSGKVTITYWGLWEDSNTMQSVISQFEQKNPTITVVYEKEDPKQYSQRLLTRVQEGNGPDIFTYHSSWLPMVKPILVPLSTSVISKSELQNNFYPVVRTDLVQNGALYGIPLEVDTLSLFVNNALFQTAKAQVPTTWDTFGTTARALTQKDENGKIKIAGAAIGTYDNVTHAPDILSALFMQNGVNISTFSPKGNAADALSFYTSFATGDSKVWDSTLDPSQLAFAKGNVAMYFGYSWDVFAIKAANPTLDFSIHPIPHLPGRNTTTASYWVEGVSAKSTHQKEALLFMQFLAQKNTAAALYAEEAKTRLFGEPYARSDLGETLRSNTLVYPFVEQATDASSSFFAGETFDTGLNGQMNGYLGNAVRSILGTTSPDSAIDTLLKGVQQVVNQYGSS